MFKVGDYVNWAAPGTSSDKNILKVIRINEDNTIDVIVARVINNKYGEVGLIYTRFKQSSFAKNTFMEEYNSLLIELDKW